ncbi:hypothetical protein FOA52_015903 [Chlamydomonas sp. UWO 241]|nr:hypothetical protein FOA52_015903 [Chlamydomonas sp. UWO 241]
MDTRVNAWGGWTVTTSEAEKHWPPFTNLMGSSKGRQQVLNYRTMYIMADLAEAESPAYVNERVLVAVKAYSDGSFDMRPGFSKPGCKYRFEDAFGRLYEYSVENASNGAEPAANKRAAKLQRAVVSRAEQIRRQALRLEFQLPPPDVCVRLLLLGEIMSVADFDWDNLYVEFMIRFDPVEWELASPWEQAEPGVVRGVTHNARACLYPNDPFDDGLNIPERWVAHYAHPIELELVSRNGPVAPNKYPVMLLQVCTFTRMHRYTCEGYGWVSLAEQAVPGCATHYVRTWKPAGSMSDKLQEFFVGGSRELEDLAYAMAPHGSDARVINKYGFKTETTGVVKVRLHAAIQARDPSAATGAPPTRDGSPAQVAQGERRTSGGGGTDGGAAAGGVQPPPPLQPTTSPNRMPVRRVDPALDAVLARAKSRLRDARGGELSIRQGVIADAPAIRLEPGPLSMPEGGMAQFRIAATGVEPLRYQWFKDEKKISVATSDTATFIIAGVAQTDEGSYHCVVTNKDGSISSARAMLKIERQARRPGRTPLRASISPESHAAGDPGSPRAGSRIVRKSRLGAGASFIGAPGGAFSGGGASDAGSLGYAAATAAALPPLSTGGLEPVPVPVGGAPPSAAPPVAGGGWATDAAAPAAGAAQPAAGSARARATAGDDAVEDLEVETLDAPGQPLLAQQPPARPAVRTGFADGPPTQAAAAGPDRQQPAPSTAEQLPAPPAAGAPGAAATQPQRQDSAGRQRTRMSSSGGGAPL